MPPSALSGRWPGASERSWPSSSGSQPWAAELAPARPVALRGRSAIDLSTAQREAVRQTLAAAELARITVTERIAPSTELGRTVAGLVLAEIPLAEPAMLERLVRSAVIRLTMVRIAVIKIAVAELMVDGLAFAGIGFGTAKRAVQLAAAWRASAGVGFDAAGHAAARPVRVLGVAVWRAFAQVAAALVVRLAWQVVAGLALSGGVRVGVMVARLVRLAEGARGGATGGSGADGWSLFEHASTLNVATDITPRLRKSQVSCVRSGR
ncbi:hypothetical protein [Flindersiella endophytica]